MLTIVDYVSHLHPHPISRDTQRQTSVTSWRCHHMRITSSKCVLQQRHLLGYQSEPQTLTLTLELTLTLTLFLTPTRTVF